MSLESKYIVHNAGLNVLKDHGKHIKSLHQKAIIVLYVYCSSLQMIFMDIRVGRAG